MHEHAVLVGPLPDSPDGDVHQLFTSGNRCLSSSPSLYDSVEWQKQVRDSAQIRRSNGLSVLVTGAAGFVGTHVSLALKKRGDGVVGLDNFNDYYDPSLKKARKNLLNSNGIFIAEGDINDARILAKVFDIVAFTHVMHLAAQAGVRYAIENPHSYVHSNVAGLVTLLEASKSANPQPAFVWASSSSFTGVSRVVGHVGKSTGSGGKKRGPAPYRIFNLGNTSPVTVPTLVSILEKHLKAKAKQNVVEMPGNGDVPFTHANISLARRVIGYKPTTDLETGLKKFVSCDAGGEAEHDGGEGGEAVGHVITPYPPNPPLRTAAAGEILRKILPGKEDFSGGWSFSRNGTV
ncbi:hypothetical protein C3L33_05583, partial [Rhododendron williamsianum]